MENFVVSARKYRPVKFEDVVGQENVTTTLKNSIKSRHLAHSFLFCGPRGVGKTTCARILAKVINCLHPTPDFEPCNECDSCQAFNKNASFNIFEIDAASNNSVDEIRSLVEQVRYPPQSGKYKIYIIDEVHMLSAAAFNAFLKTLEEPPPYAIFILATTEKHKIIPTILSRCQIFDFSRIKTDDITNYLKKISKNEKTEAEESALHIIAQKADGGLRDALSMFDRLVSFTQGELTFKNVIDNLNILDYDYYFKASDAFLVRDLSGILNLFNEVLQKGFDADDFILGLAEHFRNLLVCKDESSVKLLEASENLKNKYRQQAAVSSISFLLNALHIINECDVHYKTSKNKRLHVEMSLIKIAYINAAVKLVKENQESDLSKKKVLKSSFPVATEGLEDNKISLTIEKKQIFQDIPENNRTVNEKISTPLSKSSNIQHSSRAVKITSLDNLTKEISLAEQNKPEEESSKDYSSIVITNEEMIQSWELYCFSLKENKKVSLHSLCSNIQPVLVNNFTVELTLENALHRDMLDKERDNIFSFFKRQLKIPGLELILKIGKAEFNGQSDRAYTAVEKFKKMAEKNPALINLKNKLELDLEY